VTYQLQLSPALEADAIAAAEHYAEISPDLADRFARELERTLVLIESYPLAGRILYRDVRRMVLDRFPYLLTYRVDGSNVRVQLRAHTRRDRAGSGERLAIDHDADSTSSVNLLAPQRDSAAGQHHVDLARRQLVPELV
jgi:Plasmid stabilisation system protein.